MTARHGIQAPVILSIAYPYAPIGGSAVGGAEVILSQIEAALPSLGFESVVVAHAESQPQGRLYPTTVPAGEITDALRAEVERSQQHAIDRAIVENPVALVHMHGLDFHRYCIPTHLPVLVTLHLPPSWYPGSIWDLPANFHLLCVSETERQACPAAVREAISVVPNGVPLPDASVLRTEGRYALMLARICAEKNLHVGLDAARLAGMPAMLAGEVFPYEAHQRYFTAEIEPRLTRSGVAHEQRAPEDSPAMADARFLGPITGGAKSRLLARAACLLLPSLAPETSSLVAMEALAAGVPVIAMASGAVPEIVEHGRTGFLLDPRLGSGAAAARAMADAIAHLGEIDRKACRIAAEERFGLDRMLHAYAALYRRHALQALTPSAESNDTIGELSAAAIDPAMLAEAARIEHVTSEERFTALGPAWRDLWSRDTRATPFQHPAWLLPWWRQFGPDGELHTLALHGEQRSEKQLLLGLLPLYVYAAGDGERQLLFVGAGTSDYLNGLFDDRADAVQLASQALQCAGEEPAAWSRLHLAQLPKLSPLLAAVQATGLTQRFNITDAEPCSVIDLAQPLPAKVRANTGRYRRRAEAHGAVAASLAATLIEALENFDHLQRFHLERWDGRGEAGVLSDPRVRAHHREAIPALLEADLLRFFRLTLNGETLGVLYALSDPPTRAQRCLYLYLIGFDVRFAQFSPGTLLLHEVWQYARLEGYTCVDLLRGGEEYKQLWGARSQPTFAIQGAKSKP